MTRWTPEAKQKLREAMLAENNSQWKGDGIGLSALHWWVRQRLPKPEFCERCFHEPSYDLANITGHYTRDLSNWKYLCRRCHMWVDGRLVARDKNGKFVSIKRVKIYSPLRSHSQLKIYPNFAGSTKEKLK